MGMQPCGDGYEIYNSKDSVNGESGEDEMKTDKRIKKPMSKEERMQESLVIRTAAKKNAKYAK